MALSLGGCGAPPTPQNAQVHCLWVRRYLRFHGLRHPRDLAAPEINAFLTHLATVDGVSASTQTQALSALLFL